MTGRHASSARRRATWPATTLRKFASSPGVYMLKQVELASCRRMKASLNRPTDGLYSIAAQSAPTNRSIHTTIAAAVKTLRASESDHGHASVLRDSRSPELALGELAEASNSPCGSCSCKARVVRSARAVSGPRKASESRPRRFRDRASATVLPTRAASSSTWKSNIPRQMKSAPPWKA